MVGAGGRTKPNFAVMDFYNLQVVMMTLWWMVWRREILTTIKLTGTTICSGTFWRKWTTRKPRKIWGTYVYLYACEQACMEVSVHCAGLHTCVCACIHVCMRACWPAFMCLHGHVYILACNHACRLLCRLALASWAPLNSYKFVKFTLIFMKFGIKGNGVTSDKWALC